MQHYALHLSWTKRVQHPSEVLKKGDRVKAVVLAVEPDKRRLSLGVKQLQPDVWESFFQTHHIGDMVHGKVLRVAAFGAFVEIAEGVEGLCHKSEATDENGQPIHQRSARNILAPWHRSGQLGVTTRRCYCMP
jgi:small subunit ribosomal protein S1